MQRMGTTLFNSQIPDKTLKHAPLCYTYISFFLFPLPDFPKTIPSFQLLHFFAHYNYTVRERLPSLNVTLIVNIRKLSYQKCKCLKRFNNCNNIISLRLFCIEIHNRWQCGALKITVTNPKTLFVLIMGTEETPLDGSKKVNSWSTALRIKSYS